MKSHIIMVLCYALIFSNSCKPRTDRSTLAESKGTVFDYKASEDYKKVQKAAPKMVGSIDLLYAKMNSRVKEEGYKIMAIDPKNPVDRKRISSVEEFRSLPERYLLLYGRHKNSTHLLSIETIIDAPRNKMGTNVITYRFNPGANTLKKLESPRLRLNYPFGGISSEMVDRSIKLDGQKVKSFTQQLITLDTPIPKNEKSPHLSSYSSSTIIVLGVLGIMVFIDLVFKGLSRFGVIYSATAYNVTYVLKILVIVGVIALAVWGIVQMARGGTEEDPLFKDLQDAMKERLSN